MSAIGRIWFRLGSGASYVRAYGRRLSLNGLIEFTRSIRLFLKSGMMIRDAMRLLAVRGSRRVRSLSAGIAAELEAGWSLHDALEKQTAAFPPLFVALSAVGEESGNLPEVMADLEKYYEMQAKLRREFWSEVSSPILQFLAAVFVLAGLIYVLGILPPVREPGGPAHYFDPLGFGLLGPEGASRFLLFVFGTIAGVAALFVGLKWALRRRAIVERVLLHVPLLGGCLRAIALTRFSFSLQLMLGTGTSVLRTFRMAFAATDNAAFVAAAPLAQAELRRGNTVTNSLAAARVFPETYLGAVMVGEDTGHMTEVLLQQAEYYDDVARRKMAFLNSLVGWLVWLVVAVTVIVAIVRIFSTYVGTLDKFADDPGNALPPMTGSRHR